MPKIVASYRLSQTLLNAIAKEAASQHRTKSNLVELILSAALLDDTKEPI